MKKLLLIIILLLPSISNAQSRYLQKGENGIAIGVGAQNTASSSKGIGFASVSFGVNGKSDFGVKVGKSSNLKIIAPFLNVYLIKQSESNPVSTSFIFQAEMVDYSGGSSFYSNSSSSNSFSFGGAIEHNLFPSSSFGFTPYIVFLYTVSDNESLATHGAGLSLSIGKKSIFALDVGYYNADSENLFVASISMNFKRK